MSHTINRNRGRALHRLYESNFRLLTRLIPGLPDLIGGEHSTPAGEKSLHVRVIDRGPYTTVIALTHVFHAGQASFHAPDIWVRVYHDASVAEAIAQQDGAGPAHSRGFSGRQATHPDLKWKLNHFLHHWLHGCLRKGHCILTRDDEDFSAQLSEA